MRGLFITFEGSEGSGKSTQSKLLCQYLKKQGFPWSTCASPGHRCEREDQGCPARREEYVHVATCEMLLYMQHARRCKRNHYSALRAARLWCATGFLILHLPIRVTAWDRPFAIRAIGSSLHPFVAGCNHRVGLPLKRA